MLRPLVGWAPTSFSSSIKVRIEPPIILLYYNLCSYDFWPRYGPVSLKQHCHPGTHVLTFLWACQRKVVFQSQTVARQHRPPYSVGSRADDAVGLTWTQHDGLTTLSPFLKRVIYALRSGLGVHLGNSAQAANLSPILLSNLRVLRIYHPL